MCCACVKRSIRPTGLRACVLSESVCARRAYKLGKKRWSYNQCELKLLQEGGDQRLEVVEAVQARTTRLSITFLVPTYPSIQGVNTQAAMAGMAAWAGLHASGCLLGCT